MERIKAVKRERTIQLCPTACPTIALSYRPPAVETTRSSGCITLLIYTINPSTTSWGAKLSIIVIVISYTIIMFVNKCLV